MEFAGVVLAGDVGTRRSDRFDAAGRYDAEPRARSLVHIAATRARDGPMG